MTSSINNQTPSRIELLFKRVDSSSNSEEISKVINEVQLDDNEQANELLRYLLSKENITHAELFFNRIMHPTAGPQWAQSKQGAVTLFTTVIQAYQVDMADRLVSAQSSDFFKQRALMLLCKTTKVHNPLLRPLVSKIVHQILQKNEALTLQGQDFPDRYTSVFVSLYKKFPDLAIQFLETCSLEEDQIEFFLVLHRNRDLFPSFADRLFNRIRLHSSFEAFVIGLLEKDYKIFVYYFDRIVSAYGKNNVLLLFNEIHVDSLCYIIIELIRTYNDSQYDDLIHIVLNRIVDPKTGVQDRNILYHFFSELVCEKKSSLVLRIVDTIEQNYMPYCSSSCQTLYTLPSPLSPVLCEVDTSLQSEEQLAEWRKIITILLQKKIPLANERDFTILNKHFPDLARELVSTTSLDCDQTHFLAILLSRGHTAFAETLWLRMQQNRHALFLLLQNIAREEIQNKMLLLRFLAEKDKIIASIAFKTIIATKNEFRGGQSGIFEFIKKTTGDFPDLEHNFIDTLLAFPDLAQLYIDTVSLEDNLTSLFSHLLRRNLTNLALDLFLRIRGHSSCDSFLATLPLTSKRCIFILNILLQKRDFTRATTFYERIVTELKATSEPPPKISEISDEKAIEQAPPLRRSVAEPPKPELYSEFASDTLDDLKARLLFTALDHPEWSGWKEKVLALIEMGASLSKLVHGTSVLKKIQTVLGLEATLAILQKTPLENAAQALNLLQYLLKAKKIQFAQIIFTRICATQWIKDPELCTCLFSLVATHQQSLMALKLVDAVDVKSSCYLLLRKCAVRNLQKPLLSVCSMQKKIEARTITSTGSGESAITPVTESNNVSNEEILQRLVKKILEKKASLTDRDSKGKSAFSYLFQLFPDIAREQITSCSLDEDRTTLFSTLVHEGYIDLANQLCMRILQHETRLNFLERVSLSAASVKTLFSVLLQKYPQEKWTQTFFERCLGYITTADDNEDVQACKVGLFTCLLAYGTEVWKSKVHEIISKGIALGDILDQESNVQAVGASNLRQAVMEIPLSNAMQISTLLNTLLNIEKMDDAEILFQRIIDPKSGVQWLKDPSSYKQLFYSIACTCLNAKNVEQKSTMALALADSLHPDARCTVHYGDFHCNNVTPLMFVCKLPPAVQNRGQWQTMFTKFIAQKPPLFAVDGEGHSVFYYLHKVFPKTAQELITACLVEEDQSTLFSTLVRENLTTYADTLLKRIEGDKSFSDFLNKVVINSKSALTIFQFLLNKKRLTEAKMFCLRLLTTVSKKNTYKDTADSFKAKLILAMLPYPEWKYIVIEFVRLGADLSYKGETDKSLMENIETICKNQKFILQIVEKTPLKDFSQICDLLNDLRDRKRNELIRVLLKRLMNLINAKRANSNVATYLFAQSALAGEVDIATALVNAIDLSIPTHIQLPGEDESRALTPLMIVANSLNLDDQSKMKLIDLLIARKDSLTKRDNRGFSAFRHIHAKLPQKAQSIVENLPLQEDQSHFLLLLASGGKIFDNYLQILFVRLETITPSYSWWNGFAKAFLFMEAAQHATIREGACYVATQLIQDPALDLHTQNQNNQTALMVAVENDFDDVSINALLKRCSDRDLLRMDATDTSCFAYFVNKKRISSLSQPTMQNFLRRLGITATTYEALQETNHNLQFNDVVMRALLTNDKSWLETNFRPSSFIEKFKTIEYVTAPNRLTDLYRDIVLNYAFSINEAHYQEAVLPSTSTAPAQTSLDDLLVLYKTYIKDKTQIDAINTFIAKIRKKADHGAPSDARLRDAFYATIENQILFVIARFKKEIQKIERKHGKNVLAISEAKGLAEDLRNYFKEIIRASMLCGTALQDHARSFFTKYILEQNYDFRTRLLYDLADLRVTAVQAGLPNNEQSVHAYSGFLCELGERLGLPGSLEAKKFPDMYARGHEEEIAAAYRYFIATYTPAAIINFISTTLRNNNYYKPFNKFLDQLNSEEMRLLEVHVRTLLLETVRPILSDTTKSQEQKQKEVSELLSSDPWCFSFAEDDNLLNLSSIETALRREVNCRHIRYALSLRYISKEDNIFEYSWFMVALVLKEMNILKL